VRAGITQPRKQDSARHGERALIMAYMGNAEAQLQLLAAVCGRPLSACGETRLWLACCTWWHVTQAAVARTWQPHASCSSCLLFDAGALGGCCARGALGRPSASALHISSDLYRLARYSAIRLMARMLRAGFLLVHSVLKKKKKKKKKKKINLPAFTSSIPTRRAACCCAGALKLALNLRLS